ncbi:iron complex transport system permease protein [Nitratireductor aquibiodomus]|uniref:Iron complex transport system permease protein n=1 Tax=Nitratireductor aquibiodomus TaxID=204799 RepID=A0A1H4JU12_9HYPH|nr:iron ABC transporter permease [Nitratireductor aquibiodomus]SEB49355.1 iron complex transport system permease protein [Nitratireductor aquibiodomus]
MTMRTGLPVGLAPAGAVLILVAAFLGNLSLGATSISPRSVVEALLFFDQEEFDHFIVAYQRLPRALIAMFVGAVMACGGCVLQGLTRNPLASPSLLGVSSGATLFVIAGIFLLDIPLAWQGVVAIAGGLFGFASCLFVTRLTGMSRDPRGLGLILSGAVLSMLYSGLANALLLASPSRRSEFLSWVSGNINHAYADRLYSFWWLGAIGVALLFVLARPLTLVMLGREKAASAGVDVERVRFIALAAVVVSASAAVAVCGPIGFVGLIVPHMVRPFAGAAFKKALPANAVLGAATCLLADLAARTAFTPFVLHTGIMMDLLGGIAFAIIVKRCYLSPGARTAL